MKKVLIFDFDGVIANTFDLHLKISRYFYPDTTDQDLIDHTMGNPLLKPKIKFTKDQIQPYFKMYEDGLTAENLFPVAEYIKKLSKKYSLVICSGSSKKGILKLLNLGGMGKCFKKIYGIEVHYDKVEKFKRIFKNFDVTAPDCLFITDSVGDILEAKSVKIHTIAATWGFHTKDLLSMAEPFGMIDRIEDLKKYL